MVCCIIIGIYQREFGMQSNKYGIIVEDVISKIKIGKLKAGSRISSREELAFKYKVSPSTVNKALNLLERSGYIKKIERIGSFVTDKANEKRNLLVIIPYFVSQLEKDEADLSTLPNWLYYIETFAAERKFKIHTLVNNFMTEEAVGIAIKELGFKIDASIIISSEWFRTEWIHAALKEGNVPHIFVDQYPENADFVATDNISTVYKITKEFINMNYKHLIYISSPVKFSSLRIDRMEGFMNAIGESSVLGEIWSVTNKNNLKDLAKIIAQNKSENVAVITSLPYIMKKLWNEMKSMEFNTSKVAWGSIDSSNVIYTNKTVIIEAVQPVKDITNRVFHILEKKINGNKQLFQEFYETSLKIIK